MDPKVLEQIVEVLAAHDVTKFELQEEGVVLKLSRGGSESFGPPASTIVPYRVETERLPEHASQAATAAHGANGSGAEAALDSHLIPVISPMVGTFYRRPSPDDEEFVAVGSKVRKGQTLCIIEAMKLMNEIESPCDGEVKKILLDDSSVVEFGEHLFMIDPS